MLVLYRFTFVHRDDESIQLSKVAKNADQAWRKIIAQEYRQSPLIPSREQFVVVRELYDPAQALHNVP